MFSALDHLGVDGGFVYAMHVYHDGAPKGHSIRPMASSTSSASFRLPRSR